MGNQFGLFMLEQATKKSNSINHEARFSTERAPYNELKCRVGNVSATAIAFIPNYFFRNIDVLTIIRERSEKTPALKRAR